MQDVMKELQTRARLHAIVGELAVLTGSSELDAVQRALEDCLARLKGPISREERIERALTTLRGRARSRGAGPLPSPNEHNRALGYGEGGV